MANNVEISLIIEDLLTKQYKRIHNDIVKTNKKTTKAAQTAAQKQAAASKKAVQGLQAQKIAAVALAGVMTGVVSKSFINAQRNVDRIMNALKVGTGTVQGATREFEFLEKEANRLGLELQTTALSYAQLTAAAKNTNLSAMEQREIFLGVSEAGAALGLSASDMEGALRAVQQMISKGNVQAEELRGQLGERIPGAFSIAAKAMGLTEKELNKQLELGNVLAEDMLPKLAAELRTTFGATAAKGPETLNGKINTLKNTVFAFQRQILEDGGADFLKDVFTGAATGVEIFGKNLDLVSTAGKTFLAVFAANKLIALGDNIGNLSVKMKSLHVSMALVAGAALTIDTVLKAFEARADQIGGKDFLGSPEQVQKVRKALEVVIDLQKEAQSLNSRGGRAFSLAGAKSIGITQEEQATLDKYNKAVSVLKANYTADWDPAKVNLKEIWKGLAAQEFQLRKVANAADAAKKKIKKIKEEEDVIPKFTGNSGFTGPQKPQHQIIKESNEESLQILRDGHDERISLQDEKLKASFENFKSWNDRRISEEQRAKDVQMATNNAVLSGAGNLNNALGSLAAVRGQNELKAAEAAGAGEDKLNAIRKKSFEKQKDFSLKSAFISMAQAVLSGYTQKPFIPVGLAAGSLALLAGGVQIEAIKAQTFASGGVVQGSTTTGDHIPVRANAGEAIFNKGQQRRLLALADGRGGGGGGTINFSAPVINIQNGDPAVVSKAVNETYQEMLNNFAITQRDSEVHELSGL